MDNTLQASVINAATKPCPPPVGEEQEEGGTPVKRDLQLCDLGCD